MSKNLNDAKNFFELGVKYLDENKLPLAEEAFQNSLAIAPDRESTLINLSTVLILGEKWGNACEITTRLLELNPNSYDGYINLATVYSHLENSDLALEAIEKAISLDSDCYKGWCNKGNILLDLFDQKEALLCFDKAIQLNSLSAESYIGRANARNYFKRYKDALADLNKALEIDPSNHKIKFNKGLSLIRIGEFEEGWELFEHRLFVLGTKQNQNFSHIPRWIRNKTLSNKSLLVYSEQGFGDCIQFARYLPLLLEDNPSTRVTLLTPPPLETLMRTLHQNITIETNEQVVRNRNFDLQCPIMSLAYNFRTTLSNIPSNIPYLSIDQNSIKKWQVYLDNNTNQRKLHSFDSNGFRVGLCWEGSGKYATQSNPRRNVPFPLIHELTQELSRKIPSIEFHSLQINSNPKALPNEIHSHIDRLSNFYETGGLIKNLDLVISVDTAVAHLSGALGVPTYLLLPDPPDFLSMSHGVTHHWYPKTKLFRQIQPNDWSAPLCSIKEELIDCYLNNKKPAN